MNKTLIFLMVSVALLVLSAIVICIAPLINNIEVSSYGWKPSDWYHLNCAIFADKENSDNVALDHIQKMRKLKNLCYRQKAMYGLEHSAFIINAILAFVCGYLTLLHYLNVGKDFEKKTGLIGLISGVIGFVLTLLYVCYSGYIFNNDVAYGKLDSSNQDFLPGIQKLYPNGAKYKIVEGNQIPVYQNEKGEYSAYIKYKDLGKKQYNYDSKYYETYKKGTLSSSNCNIDNPNLPLLTTCKYYFYTPYEGVENKYIYDRWLTSLILAVIIFICDLALAIFGLLLFLQKGEQTPPSEEMPIIYKK